MKLVATFVLAVCTLIVVEKRVVAQEELSKKRFKELRESIVPAENLSPIDWQPDLLEAQKMALEQKKPMFIWSMDGHPLGCT